MTSSRRLTEAAEFDVEADRAVEELEGLLEAIPQLIFAIRLAQAGARRELREAGEVDLVLMGDRQAAREVPLRG